MANPAPSDPEALLAHAGWIRALARRLVGDGPAADDLVQDTWLAALESRPDATRSLRPWLARVAHNFARQRGRRRGSRPASESLGSALGSGTGLSPDDLVARGELQALLVQRVLELREPFRSTVLLRFYEGLEPAEIAHALGVEPATVRSRLKRAIDELRVRLDAEHGGERRTWVLAFAPLAALGGATPSLSGALMKTTAGKACATVGAMALLALGGLAIRDYARPTAAPAREAPASGEALAAPRDAVAELEPHAPVEPRELAPRREVGEGPVQAVAPAPTTAFFEGVLLDANTREPLPHYLLDVKHEDWLAELYTDADGRFRSAQELASGTIEVHYRDHRELPGSFVEVGIGMVERWDSSYFDASSAEPDELLIDSGPTYRLDLSGQLPVADSGLVAVVLGPADSFRNTLGSVYRAPVRGGERGGLPWVRFLPLPMDLLPRTAPWRLDVFSQDGFWFGTGETESIRGVQPDPVSVELAARGRLTGSVRDGRDAVTGVSVELRPTDSRGESVCGRTDDAGSFALEWAVPGRYELILDPPRHEPWSKRVKVRALETTDVTVRLRGRAIAGDVRGRLTSRTGTYANNLLVILDGQGAGTPDMNQGVSFHAENGAQVADFAFEDLPHGDYVVSVLSMLDKFAWTPQRVTVAAPATDLAFEVLDDVPTAHVTFEVVDADTGIPVEPFTLAYSTNGAGMLALGGMGAEGPHLYDFPVGNDILWGVAADGYASTFGDETAFDFDASGDPLLRLDLIRGWGARLVVVDDESGAPVADAVIEVDGREVARTDADGRAEVFHAFLPGEVRATAGQRAGVASDLTHLKFRHPIRVR